ncbi:MAG: hypothetical protein R3E09_02190 [Novosphingobium sp.]
MHNHWSAGIGDPGLFGWLTVAVYFGTAFVCALAAKAAKYFQQPAHAPIVSIEPSGS